MIHHWKGLRKLNPNDPLGILYDLTESRNSRWRTPDQNFNLNTYGSACRQHRNEISKAKLMFSGSTYPMELPGMLYDLTGSGKAKMASFKPEVPVSQRVDKIGTKFQRLHPPPFSRSSVQQ